MDGDERSVHRPLKQFWTNCMACFSFWKVSTYMQRLSLAGFDDSELVAKMLGRDPVSEINPETFDFLRQRRSCAGVGILYRLIDRLLKIATVALISPLFSINAPPDSGENHRGKSNWILTKKTNSFVCFLCFVSLGFLAVSMSLRDYLYTTLQDSAYTWVYLRLQEDVWIIIK